MNIGNYFRALSKECEAYKDRVRHFINDAHWPTDGEWKESVLRNLIRRSAPNVLAHERELTTALYDHFVKFPRSAQFFLKPDGEVVHATVMYSSRLRHMRYDPYAWLIDEPGDWNMWRRMQATRSHLLALSRRVSPSGERATRFR